MALELLLDIYSIPSIIALMINLIILIFILRIRPIKIQNIFFMLMLIGFVIWAGGQIVVRSATDVDTAILWGHLEYLSGHFAVLFFLCFVLAFTGIYNKNNSKYLYGFVIPYVVIITFLVYYTYEREKMYIIRTQAKLIFIGSSIPIIIGGTTDVILPSLGITVFELAGVLTVFMAGFIAFAIIRYRFMFPKIEIIAKVVFDSMNDSVIVIDTSENITNVNKATSNLLGFKEPELIGKPIREIVKPASASSNPNPNPGSNSKFKNVEFEKLLKGNDVKDVEMVYKTKDGRRIPISFSGSLMKGETGDIEGAACVAKDMRETKMYQDLQHAYQELKTVQAQLLQKEKLAGIGSLAARVAHEINNPLQVIIGTTEIILGEDDPNQIREDAKELLLAADRITKIVGDLSIYSRDSSTISVQPLDLNQLLKQSCGLVKFSSNLDNIKIKYDLQKLSKIKLNKEEMQQVFINLIKNAIDAMDGNGELTLSTHELDNFIWVQITDTGKGISSGDQKKVFDPFFTTKEVGKGTGLGLFVVHQIIKRYHGLIDFQSRLGMGTSVIIQFPVNVNI
jgi:PAS domain S-box-containing protein